MATNLKRNMQLLRAAAGSSGRAMSKLVGKDNKQLNGNVEGPIRNRDGCWVPHPRSGIYFPAGQEWVMNDVPENAAVFNRTYWLRSVDGVDQDQPNLITSAAPAPAPITSINNIY